jgi:large subunit ribosomal protein L3
MIEGIIGKKIGMTQMFPDDGRLVAMTAIEAGPCVVTQVKTEATEGYNAVQLGFSDAKKLNKPEKGHLQKLKLCRHLREFRVEDASSIQIGQVVDADVFKPGDIVDVIGISKGRGFAGGVKRHHFAGGPKTHGQSDRHRAPGSVGANTSPGRVLKGLRMAGHMGDAKVTVRNLEIIQADAQRHLLMVKGAVPGGRNGLLLIRKSRKA